MENDLELVQELELSIRSEEKAMEELSVLEDNLRDELRELKREYREQTSLKRNEIEPNFVLDDAPIWFQSIRIQKKEEQQHNDKSSNKQSDAKKDRLAAIDLHTIDISEVFAKFNTTSEGLNDEQVKIAIHTYGVNKLAPKEMNYFLMTARHLFSGFGFLLWIAAILSALAWKPLGDPPGISLF